MNSTAAADPDPVGLLLEWSNCPKVLLSVASFALGDAVFRRLADVELRSGRSSSDEHFLQSLVAGCCGCCGGDDTDGGGRGGRRGKRRGKHSAVERDSISRTVSRSPRSSGEGPIESWRDEHTMRNHLTQPALMLSYAAAVLSTSRVVHVVSCRRRATAPPRHPCAPQLHHP
jgi:hypothetical protein